MRNVFLHFLEGVAYLVAILLHAVVECILNDVLINTANKTQSFTNFQAELEDAENICTGWND